MKFAKTVGKKFINDYYKLANEAKPNLAPFYQVLSPPAPSPIPSLNARSPNRGGVAGRVPTGLPSPASPRRAAASCVSHAVAC